MTAAVKKARVVRGIARRHDVKTMSGSVGCWFTSPEYAAHVARWGRIRPGDRVLDLGAGIGNLTLAALGVGAIVTAIEIDRTLEPRLRARINGRAHVVIADAFDPHLLSRIPHDGQHRDRVLPFDVVISNPKWESDFEVRFLLRALELAPRAIGIISLDGLVSSGRDERGWQHMRITRDLLSPGRLSFSLDGSSGQEWPIAVDVVKRPVPRVVGAVDHIERSYFTPPRRA